MAGRVPRQPYVCADRGRFYVRGLPDCVASPGGFASRRAAEVWLEGKADLLALALEAELAAGKGKVRSCMCCERDFTSEGPHNRLCDGCRKRGSAEPMAAGYSFGAMTGRRKSA